MSNKFLNLYPAFWVPKIGDKVRVIQLLDSERKKVRDPDKLNWNYQVDDIGIITRIGVVCYGIYFIKTGERSMVFHEEIELYFENYEK